MASRVIRLRYLIKDPDTYDAKMGRVVRGTWRRCWLRTWNAYRGRKKVVTGKRTLMVVPALRGWE